MPKKCHDCQFEPSKHGTYEYTPHAPDCPRREEIVSPLNTEEELKKEFEERFLSDLTKGLNNPIKVNGYPIFQGVSDEIFDWWFSKIHSKEERMKEEIVVLYRNWRRKPDEDPTSFEDILMKYFTLFSNTDVR